jgi:hypothetical protein
MDLFALVFLRSLVVYTTAIVDEGLQGTTSRQLIAASEVQDLLLDIRGYLGNLAETLENWEEQSSGCIPHRSADGLEGEHEGV